MDDLEFVHKCCCGDKQSWEEFLQRYSRLIYSYIYSTFRAKGKGVLTSEAANDIFQEAILSLIKDDFRKLRTFQGRNKCSLASWLRQVTINFTLDQLRRQKSLVSLDEEAEGGFSLLDVLQDGSAADAQELAWEKEKLAGLKDCIEGLSLNDKWFLELHISQGVTLEELRLHLKVSRGTVDMRKKRIIERLKECFRLKGFVFPGQF